MFTQISFCCSFVDLVKAKSHHRRKFQDGETVPEFSSMLSENLTFSVRVARCRKIKVHQPNREPNMKFVIQKFGISTSNSSLTIDLDVKFDSYMQKIPVISQYNRVKKKQFSNLSLLALCIFCVTSKASSFERVVHQLLCPEFILRKTFCSR